MRFNRYHEPFLGGGSFFFAVAGGHDAYLSDSNEALIETYICIRDDVSNVIDLMRLFQNTERSYYDVRSTVYNSPVERAAAFIYLNQTSFNGIYRVNLRGVYNVPYGRKTKPFLEEEILKRASVALQDTDLKSCDFDETLTNIQAGDLVFIDPPYTVSHNANGFIKYNKSLFALNDQYRLAKYIKSIRAQGAHYILTNAAHPVIEEIFDLADHRVELSRANVIGGKLAQRGPTSEYLFTSLEVRSE